MRINSKKCNDIISVECGPLFCTTSKIVCAQTILQISADITSVIGMVSGGAPSKNSKRIVDQINKNTLDKKFLQAINSDIRKITQVTMDNYGKYSTLMGIIGGSLFSGNC